LLANDAPIDLAHLPPPGEDLSSQDEDDAPSPSPATRAAASSTAAPSPSTIETALAKTGGNVIRAAELIDVRPRQLYRWIARFNVPLDKYRASSRS
jgi:DNA-binding NtrC family response regulator